MLEVPDGNEGEHVVARGSTAICEMLREANEHARQASVCNRAWKTLLCIYALDFMLSFRLR